MKICKLQLPVRSEERLRVGELKLRGPPHKRTNVSTAIRAGLETEQRKIFFAAKTGLKLDLRFEVTNHHLLL